MENKLKENFFSEPAKRIKIFTEADVIIVGGGPSGVAAALGAAKAGATTVIIETLNSFGGMWTNGMVITLAGFNNWLAPYQRVVRGVTGEWIRRASQLGGCEDNRSWVLNSDPEIMKLVADELLLENGVTCLLHSWVADVIIEDNKLKGVIVENVDGRLAILGKVVVDCTGNGDLIARAGEVFHLSQDLQPMTLPFYLGDVEQLEGARFDEELIIPMGPEPGYLNDYLLDNYTSRRRDIGVDKSVLKAAVADGLLPTFGGPWFGGLRKNFPWVNTTRIYGSAVDASDLTRCEMQARKDVFKIIDFYKKEFKEFKDSWLLRTASTIGIRETRRLDGVYTLKGADIINTAKFTDSIAVGTWPIDVHPPKGKTGMHKMYVPLPYQIPYRSLLPKTVDNLIVAGRCISADRHANGSARVGATCGAIGHAAGIAAALSSAQNTTPRDIEVKLIQNEIINQNGIIEI